MRAGAEQWLSCDESGRKAALDAARGYIGLLHSHIIKEDRFLFPLADRTIPPEEQQQISEAFERVEHEETGEGVHEKYLALAEKLEKDSLEV